MNTIPVALVGARGYVGIELMRLLVAHPRFRLVYAASREQAGQVVADRIAGAPSDLRYSAPSPESLPALASSASRRTP